MLEFNLDKLRCLSFSDIRTKLSREHCEIVLEKVVSIPEADILCCLYKGKKFNLKFDLDYGVFFDPVDKLIDTEITEIVIHLLN